MQTFSQFSSKLFWALVILYLVASAFTPMLIASPFKKHSAFVERCSPAMAEWFDNDFQTSDDLGVKMISLSGDPFFGIMGMTYCQCFEDNFKSMQPPISYEQHWNVIEITLTNGDEDIIKEIYKPLQFKSEEFLTEYYANQAIMTNSYKQCTNEQLHRLIKIAFPVGLNLIITDKLGLIKFPVAQSTSDS